MLVRFAVGNHRSIKEPIELSLVAVDADRAAVRHFERLPQGILTLAAIYGPNASGKSNVLDALGWVSHAVRNSLRLWEEEIPREPFRFSGYPELPTSYEIEFIFQEVRHVYSLHVNDSEVLFEELLSYPEKKPRQLFVREGLDLHFRRGIPGAGAFQDLLTPTTLTLSLARRFETHELQRPARYLSNISTPFMRRRIGRPGGVGGPLRNGFGPPTYSNQSTTRMFLDQYRYSMGSQRVLFGAEPESDLDMARKLLRFADLGIEDVEIVETNDKVSNVSRLDLRLIHRAGQENVPFEMREESDGTQMWFRLIGPVLTSLRNGAPLLLDEIDASLHPLLSARMLDLFRDPDINKRNAQIIFTTHDTTLLGELNRDEVWFSEKGPDGATRLTASAEFGGDRVRKSLNLERAYLSGRFGGIPQLSKTEIDSVSILDEEELGVDDTSSLEIEIAEDE